uniref:Uncharacterized protein n=1 Tax=Seriola lalandi dorsalis TaxID=1841481 RepID=A0A3B4WQ70_SERLL
CLLLHLHLDTTKKKVNIENLCPEFHQSVRGQNRCVTLTGGCVTLPEGESFPQSSAQTVNLCLTERACVVSSCDHYVA